MGACCDGSSTADAGLVGSTDMKDFSFNGCRKRAFVWSVYDGDTVRLRFRHGEALVQWKCRLAGIDAPELRAADLKQKEAAKAAKAALVARVERRVVDVEFYQFDKYGRPLVVLHVDGAAINPWMIAAGHAVAYAGGKKGATDA